MALRPATLVSDAFRRRATLTEVGHRPWPLPRCSWLMGPSWVDLLFVGGTSPP